MDIKKIASAGSLESNDVFVTLAPGKNGREISIKSIVSLQFKDAILRETEKTLDALGVDNVIVEINDMGALDFVIRSRVETAILRARSDE